MGTEATERPAWSSRLFAVAFYLGLAPLLALFRRHQRNAYLQYHFTQAIVFVGILAYILLGGLIGFVAGAFLIVYHEDVWRTYSVDMIEDVAFAVALLLWAVAWLLALVLALMGSVRAVPLLRRLTSSRRARRAALIGNIGLGLAVATVGVLTLHALALTREDARAAPVYMLYDSGNAPVPRWVFALGFYRISLAAQARWGPDNVVVAPLTEDNLRLAMQHGRFVFLASHGTRGYITTPHMLVLPEKVQSKSYLWTLSRALTKESFDPNARLVKVGNDLQFVYISACECGAREDLWQAALAPAEVRTFPHTSAVGEHILWMWFDGPDRIQEIK